MADELERSVHGDKLAQNEDEIQVVVGDEDAAATRRRSHEALGCTIGNLPS